MIIRSKYLIDSTGRAVEDAEVVIEGKRIAGIRGKCADPPAAHPNLIDLGCAALLPGFVNAPAHLELTHAHSLVQPQPRFTDWIREVVRATGGWTNGDFESSLRRGIDLSAKSGTTTIGDVGHGARNIGAYIGSGMRVRLFHEVIGFDPSVAEEMIEFLKTRIAETPSGENLLIGISPHTPFTVSERLLRRCAELAHRRGLPLCVHLAETPAELEFLGSGTGEILEFRKEFGLPPEWKPPRASPVRYLHQIGFFEKPATLIHGNYIGEEDFDILALSGSSVVFCPRSHNYFGHREHPFPKMLEHGINVALGTDSLISASSLSILDEMKFLREEYPGIEPAVLLKMATANGAKALGLAADIGLLAPGAPADMVGVALPEAEIGRSADPLETVFSKDSKVIFSMAAGKILHSAQRFPHDV